MSESIVPNVPAASLARIEELFRALSESRSNLQSFTFSFVRDLESLRERLTNAEVDWQRNAAAACDGDEIEQLLVRLAEAEAALERSEQELSEQPAAAQASIAPIDDDARRLIDDLITERDALQQELNALRRSTG